MNKPETMYHTKTIQVGNAVVTIHRPILSDRERKSIEENIVSALGRYGRAVEGMKC
jgi:hypothetical protein